MTDKNSETPHAELVKVSEEYSRLYHYTTWSGLTGILQSQSLWGTHYKFLNDSTEALLFKDKLPKVLSPVIREEYLKALSNPIKRQNFIAKGGSDASLEDIIMQDTLCIISALYRATYSVTEGFYITSFCGEYKTGNVEHDKYINDHGLLSQWRGYGQDGGFALVFNTLKLESALEKESSGFEYAHLGMADIVYSDDDKRFESELTPSSDLNEYIRAMVLHTINRSIDADIPNAAKGYSAFVGGTTRFKHRGFKEENEVRIIAQPVTQNDEYRELAKQENVKLKADKERKFRERNGMRVPYISFFEGLNITLPIEQIIVGPHKEKENRAVALRVMLRDTGIDVTVSDIPYIGQ